MTRVLTAAGFDAITTDSHDVTLHAPDEPDARSSRQWLIELVLAGAALQAQRRRLPNCAARTGRWGAARLVPANGERATTRHHLATGSSPRPPHDQ